MYLNTHRPKQKLFRLME